MKAASVEFVRFFAVTLAGLCVDLGIGWTAAQLTGWPLWVCATLGFAAGGVTNYVLHERWTFRRAEAGFSARRVGAYLVATLVTLGVRYAVLAVIPLGAGPVKDLVRLVGAAGVSFLVNYGLSRFVVFAPGRGR